MGLTAAQLAMSTAQGCEPSKAYISMLGCSSPRRLLSILTNIAEAVLRRPFPGPRSAGTSLKLCPEFWAAPELLGEARRHSVSLTRLGISGATTSAMGTRLCADPATSSILLRSACDRCECILNSVYSPTSAWLAACHRVRDAQVAPLPAKNTATMGRLNMHVAIGALCR